MLRFGGNDPADGLTKSTLGLPWADFKKRYWLFLPTWGLGCRGGGRDKHLNLKPTQPVTQRPSKTENAKADWEMGSHVRWGLGRPEQC